MKIEIGKKYVTRDGEHVTVVSRSAAQGYPFLVVSDDGVHFTCTERGEVWGFGASNGRDLVDEREPCAEEQFEELEEQLACSERAVRKWEETAASVASVRDYYSRIIKEVADAIGPAAYTGDDGSVQPIPLRARLACRVQDLQATILEQERQIERHRGILESIGHEEVRRELGLAFGVHPYEHILPGIRSLKERIGAKCLEADLLRIELAELKRQLKRQRPLDQPALEMQVGGAYLCRNGNIAIIVSSDEDLNYPFDVETKNGARWSATRRGTEFRADEGDDDLVARIRFPEANVAAPEGFVCVGNKLLPEYHDAEDIKVCSWGDNGNNEYCVRIGSPVHFAFATKFTNEA